jgi:hypothetical protein
MKASTLAFVAFILFTIGAHAQTYTIFGNAVPKTPVDPDTAAVTLGVKFTSSQPGKITGIRFYRGRSSPTGYSVAIYSASGTPLAQTSVAADTCTVPCWEQVSFTAPVSIDAHTQYIAAYYMPNGRYAGDNYGLLSNVTNSPLTALSSGSSGGNGVYRYGSGIGFPTSTWNASNYYVDILFTLSTALPQTIASVGIVDPNTFKGGSPSGTVIGNIGVTMSPATPSFSGSLSLSGTDAALFQLVGTTLTTNGVVPAGTYHINIIASEIGISNSPYTQPETITGTALLLSINPPNPTISSQAALGDTVATIQASWSDGNPFTGPLSFGSPYYDDGTKFAISGNNLIINPAGPGISGNAGTTQNVTIVATQSVAETTSRNVGITITPAGSGAITDLSLSNSSFTGGAATGTTVGNIVVTTSDGSNPTLSLTGTDRGSGNDANSFRIASGSTPTLQTNTAGGTDQAGQYAICIVASGNYSNSPQQICPTVQATGPGGAGWQLTFSDEFIHPVLNWQNQQTPTSITWGTGSGFCSAGCGQVILPTPGSQVVRAGQTVSISGTTNSGSGGSSAINTNFAVYSVTDDEHFVIYMPAARGVFGSLGVSGASLGTGPWVTSIVNSCNSPCTNPTMVYTNNASEGWAPENVTVGSGGLSILYQNTPYTDANGAAHTYKSGHIQTWNGNAGFAQAAGNGWAMDFYGQPATGGNVSGLWSTYWALGSDNSWPGTGTGGGELDIAEFAGYSCAFSLYDMNTFGAGGTQGLTSPTRTFVGTNHQFTATNIGGTVTWFLDGSSIRIASGFQPADSFFPIIDTEYPSNCGANATLPATMKTRYVRVYSKVTSGACYSTVPTAASGITPHFGSC